MQTPLPMTEPINYVAGASDLAKGKVFLLLVNDGKWTVVKQEMQAYSGKQLSHNLNAMKTVNPAAQSKVLDATEINAIKDYAEAEIQLFTDAALACPPELRSLQQLVTTGGALFKMPKYDGMIDLKAAMDEGGSKNMSRKIAKALNDPGGLETLGKIIAADMYNHNSDRINIQVVVAGEGSGVINQRTGKAFKCIQNPGNVLFAVNAGKYQPIGLDSFDPNSMFKNVTSNIEDLEEGGEKWWGRFLVDGPAEDKIRKKLAQLVIEDIESALTARKYSTRLFTRKRLDSNAEKRLLKGLDQGRHDLITKARNKRVDANTPAGIASRVRILLGQ
jgi:hypothetical protein